VRTQSGRWRAFDFIDIERSDRLNSSSYMLNLPFQVRTSGFSVGDVTSAAQVSLDSPVSFGPEARGGALFRRLGKNWKSNYAMTCERLERSAAIGDDCQTSKMIRTIILWRQCARHIAGGNATDRSAS